MQRRKTPSGAAEQDPRPPRIVAGFGRSGTTWVQDVLAESNSLRAVFEPLHPEHIHGAADHAHKYLLPGDRDDALRQFLAHYFFEDFHSLWADYRIVPRRLRPRLQAFTSLHRLERYLAYGFRAKANLLRYRHQRRSGLRLTKFVRANMMLGWIKKNFDARIVFIIRHPAAVVLSQMRILRAWKPQERIFSYRQDSRLLDEVGTDIRELLFRGLSDVEALTLSWCIENTIALRQARDNDIPVIYYEALVRQGPPEWQRILSALDLAVPPDEALIRQPSQQTWGGKDTELLRRYAHWMEQLDRPTALKIQEILDATGMAIYRVDQALPVATK